MTTQVNIKLDDKFKMLADRLARQLGFSLSRILRAYLMHFVRTGRIEFALDHSKDTPDNLTGKKLEKILLSEGEDSNFAKEMGDDYDAMLDDERKGLLIEYK